MKVVFLKKEKNVICCFLHAHNEPCRVTHCSVSDLCCVAVPTRYSRSYSDENKTSNQCLLAGVPLLHSGIMGSNVEAISQDPLLIDIWALIVLKSSFLHLYTSFLLMTFLQENIFTVSQSYFRRRFCKFKAIWKSLEWMIKL